jgi:hypothetical protein
VRAKEGDGLALAAIEELEILTAESGDGLILGVADGDGELDETGLGGDADDAVSENAFDGQLRIVYSGLEYNRPS